jgi:adenosylcobinamide-GDP ribazoletransferase
MKFTTKLYLIYRSLWYMSPVKAIKTFRDMLSFFTIIPVGNTEDFIITTAEHISLFPVVGAFIGLLGAAYFLASGFLLSYILLFINFLVQVPTAFLLRFVPAIMTVAFLLVLTGLQHFDGLIDLGNAVGSGNLEERRAVAHRWVVSYKGAVLAITVEFLAFFGLFFLNSEMAFFSLIAAEVAAKLAVVTIAVVGKPTHKGLGSIFLDSAKRKRSVIAYLIAVLIVVPLLGLIGVGIILVSVLLGVLMGQVGKSVLGGVSGDMMGATNEVVRATVLVFVAGVLML